MLHRLRLCLRAASPIATILTLSHAVSQPSHLPVRIGEFSHGHVVSGALASFGVASLVELPSHGEESVVVFFGRQGFVGVGDGDSDSEGWGFGMSMRMMTGRRGSQEVVFVVASKGKAIGGLDVAFVVGGGDLPAVEGFAGFGVAGYQRGDVDGLGGAVGRGEGLGEMDVGDAVLVKASRPKSPGIVAQRRLDGLLNVHQFVQFFVLLLPSHQFLCRGLAAPVIATTPPMRPLHPLAGLEGDLPRVDVAEAVGAVAF
mmetsp:Transcript_4787/g.9470  ORF Transcript_4787/g.9470 Transcript_4787/m.9470 type:complete len:257 (+) Transcript_4787:1563-2333(+)